MMNKILYTLIAVVVVYSPCMAKPKAGAGSPKVSFSGAGLAQSYDAIWLRADAPLPKWETISDPKLWHVMAQTDNQTPTPVAVKEVRQRQAAKINLWSAAGLFQLALERPFDPNALPDSIQIVPPFGAKPLFWSKKKTTKPQDDPLGFFPAGTKDKADVYLNTSGVAGVGAKPQYSIDAAFASPPVSVSKPANSDFSAYLLSFSGKANASDRPAYDLDSFSAGFHLERRFPKPLSKTGICSQRCYENFSWDFAQLEFSRKDKAANLVSSPSGTLSVRKAWYTKPDRAKGILPQAKGSIALNPSLGLEFGGNLRNDIVPGGYGGIFRIVPGAALYITILHPLHLKKIVWTTDYRDRILATKEPFVDTRAKGRTYLARGSRHHLTNQVTLNFNEFFALDIKHEYGSLPPAFKFVDHKLTLGFTVMWSWKNAKG